VSVVGGRSYSRDKSPILASGEEKLTMVVVAEQGAPPTSSFSDDPNPCSGGCGMTRDGRRPVHDS